MKKVDERKLLNETQYREARIDKRAVDEESRTVELAFSSESPVERWYGIEILDHDEKSIRMDRLRNGGAVLMDHNTSDQIGVVEEARIDPDRRGRAKVRFGRSARAEEIWNDVVDGIRSLVSVGYAIHGWEVSEGQKGAPDTVRMTDWEPFEVSFVAVPADTQVGVGRSADSFNEARKEAMKQAPDAVESRDDTPTASDQRVGDEVQTPEIEDPNEALEQELEKREAEKRAERIRGIADKFKDIEGSGELAKQFIELDGSVEDFQRALLKRVQSNVKPVPVINEKSYITGGLRRYKPLVAYKNQGEETAYRMGMWARAHLFRDQRALSWCKDHGLRVAVEGILSSGGAVVPEEMSQAIIDLREEYGAMRRCARVIPMNSDSMLIPRRTGGVTAYWLGEASSITASDKSWDQIELTAKKLAALSRFSTEYAEDAIIDVGDDLASEMAYAFASSEDQAWIDGDGTSTYGGHVGMRTLLVDGSHGAGAIDAATAGHDTFGEIDGDDVDRVLATIPQYARAGAKVLCSTGCKQLVFDALARAAGGNTKMDVAGKMMDAYLGFPIEIAQHMPNGATTNYNNVVMFLVGNFMQACTVGDRRGFRIKVLNELYAATDEIGIQGTTRVAINNHDFGDGSNAGPVVGLVGFTS